MSPKSKQFRIVYGVCLILTAPVLFGILYTLETSAGSDIYLPWFVVLLYKAGGKRVVAGFIVLGGLLVLCSGLSRGKGRGRRAELTATAKAGLSSGSAVGPAAEAPPQAVRSISRRHQRRRREKVEGIVICSAVMVYVSGAACCIPGYRDWDVLARSTETPREVSLADLAARGSPDNIHVSVRDFVLGQEYHVLQSGKRWDYVAIPVRPPGGVPAGCPVIVKSFKVKKPDQLESVYASDRLVGLLKDASTSLSLVSRQDLQRHFPGQDLSEALVIEIGDGLPSPRATYATLITGTALMFVGLAGVWGLLAARRLAAGRLSETAA